MNWKNNALKLGAIALSATALTLTSCKKEGCMDETALNYDSEAQKDDGTCEYQEYGDVMLEFEHVFGMSQEDFSLNKDFVHPKTGDTLNFSMFKYYVSNIKLKTADGTWWEEEESYHLVCESCEFTNTITLKNIPEGDYVELSYTLGVDSTRNVSGAQTGALSVENEMFWSWNSGYIMLKAEGTSPNAGSGSFAYHLGGFSGEYNVVNTRSTDFGGEILTIEEGHERHLIFKANAAQLWHMGTSVSEVPMIHMPGENAYHAAKHFFDGITFSMIHH